MKSDNRKTRLVLNRETLRRMRAGVTVGAEAVQTWSWLLLCCCPDTTDHCELLTHQTLVCDSWPC